MESQQSTQHWEVQSKPQSYGLSFANLNQCSSFPLDVPVKNLTESGCLYVHTYVEKKLGGGGTHLNYPATYVAEEIWK